MAISVVDWQVFAAVLLWLVLIVSSLEEVSAMLDVLAALATLILAAVLDSVALGTASDFVRFGLLGVFFVLSIVLFVRGALGIPKEVAG